MAHRTEVMTQILRFAQTHELDAETGEHPGEVVLVLPGERKLRTVTSLVVGRREVSLTAFVVRNPDENHQEFYRHLLGRNLRMRTGGLAYAIDASGDVFVVGSVPLAHFDDETLDRLLGAVLDAADTPFNELLVLGFLTSMKREWAWRISRGEPLFNLEAFRHLLEGCEHDPRYAPAAAAPDAVGVAAGSPRGPGPNGPAAPTPGGLATPGEAPTEPDAPAESPTGSASEQS